MTCDLLRKPFYLALTSYRSSSPAVVMVCGAVVLEGSNVVHTDSAEVAPGTIRETSTSTSAGMSSTPATLWRGPRARSIHGSSVRKLVDCADEDHHSSIYPASALKLPLAAPAPIQDLCQQELEPPLMLCPCAQTTSLSTFCPTPAQRDLSHQLYVPFSSLSQQEIGPNPSCTKVPDNLWDASQNGECGLSSPKGRTLKFIARYKKIF
ncbi:hypothetical protein HPG69_019399 [Diceros bicornis minor]|uniref:Uncharacterized protein n=1 Tax=Diceros bicornis minor TaxID=77932 RepID=A0A7J7EZW3_DICBM|nr:hypothetical protein HPG69_019399 [Diceros bicornis minor]